MRVIKPLAALLLGVLAAAAVFWRCGARESAPQDNGGRRPAPARAATSEPRRAVRPRIARVPAGTGGVALAKEREIDAMSPSFRETSFLIAIRGSGYQCEDVIGAEPAGDMHAAWRVSCREAAAYLVSIDAAGRLEVEPTPYGEGQPFNIIERGKPPLRGPAVPRPPRPQPYFEPPPRRPER